MEFETYEYIQPNTRSRCSSQGQEMSDGIDASQFNSTNTSPSVSSQDNSTSYLYQQQLLYIQQQNSHCNLRNHQQQDQMVTLITPQPNIQVDHSQSSNYPQQQIWQQSIIYPQYQLPPHYQFPPSFQSYQQASHPQLYYLYPQNQTFCFPQQFIQQSFQPNYSKDISFQQENANQRATGSSNTYFPSNQFPIRSLSASSIKNPKIEAMRRRLSFVDTGKGGLIMKQFRRRHTCCYPQSIIYN